MTCDRFCHRVARMERPHELRVAPVASVSERDRRSATRWEAQLVELRGRFAAQGELRGITGMLEFRKTRLSV